MELVVFRGKWAWLPLFSEYAWMPFNETQHGRAFGTKVNARKKRRKGKQKAPEMLVASHMCNPYYLSLLTDLKPALRVRFVTDMKCSHGLSAEGTVKTQRALSWESSAATQPWSRPTAPAPVCWSAFTLTFQLEASSFSTSMVDTHTRAHTHQHMHPSNMNTCKGKWISSSSPRQKNCLSEFII